MTKEERLAILREVTELDTISSIRLYRIYKNTEYLGMMNGIINYKNAEEMEYEMRMKALREKLRKPYEKYISIENDGAILDDFVEKYIERHSYILDKGKTI